MMKRALVVDDDRSMVQTLSDVLELKGWAVRPAYSGASAVQAAIEEDFDVVLMDVKMPGIDGVDAFKAMKQLRPNIRVILMTAYAAPERLNEAQQAGVMRVLSKPVNIGELLDMLSRQLDSEQPVLLIDHDIAFLDNLAQVLRSQGFDVATARDLSHASRLLTKRRPLAVLLHLDIGENNIRDAVAAVHSANPAVAIILYSEQQGADAEVDRVIPREWVHAYLQKPFDIDDVTRVLEELRDAD